MHAKRIADSLDGHKSGSSWMARCPAHDDRTPSLSIRDANDKVLVHCFAGCAQRDVISALAARGLWPIGSSDRVPILSRRCAKPDNKPQSDLGRSAAARSIWQASAPAAETLVEEYLASRGLPLPHAPTIRFHPRLKHRSSKVFPGMVARVQNGSDGEAFAIHRTFLAPDGSGKAPVKPPKMMLGPSKRGAVRLAAAGELLMVGEGIETCLAAMQKTGHPAWAGLSAEGLRAIHLPPNVRKVVVLADGDDTGDAAARDCARRLIAEGREVQTAQAPPGKDFNDPNTPLDIDQFQWRE